MIIRGVPHLVNSAVDNSPFHLVRTRFGSLTVAGNNSRTHVIVDALQGEVAANSQQYSP